MPKQACCCNPVGRHIAVACRYYGRSGVASLNGDVGVASGASGASGSTGGSTTNIITGIDYGYGGPDGFSTVTGGIQKFFGWTSYGESFGNEPIFGSDGSGYSHRGPVKWVAEIKQFDTTRDVILLSRSGGGSSQYEWDEAEPKGGHSALLQTRVKASLALEGLAGIGGNNYIGGFPSLMGEQLEGNSDPTIVGGGAGGGGGKDARGGYGGITYGYRGDGSFGGYGGGQNSAGLAGGPSAFNGGTLYGGFGANDGGGGGGGRYAGGGGDQGSGGGGGASKWPSNQGGSSFDDVNYSEDASDRGPGGVCDPFINYYPLDTLVYGWHAGMGGGANVVFDLEADQNLNSSTRFLGFGYDYNPFKQGIPGIITAIWVDKYCPCSEIAEGSTGATGGQGVELEAQEESTQTSNSSTELPAKMYICLTDEQYQVLENFKDPENQDLDVSHPRFTLDGEVYVYVGVCVNSYCPSIRLVEGTPTNLAKTDLGGGGAASFNGTYNDCCDVMICSRYCKLPEADCYSCRCNTTCLTDFSKPKYCCENLDEKPDEYWSVSEGWLWRCAKRKQFWYPFGLTPEDILPPTNELSIDGMAVNGPFEKGCLPITATGLCGSTLEAFINSNCFPENPNLNCTDYLGWNSEKCTASLSKKYWEGKLVWPFSVNADLCADLKDYQLYAFDTSLPVNCDCLPTDIVSCVYVGCNKESKNYSFSFSECDLIPAYGGGYFGRKHSGCTNIFNPNGKIQCDVYNSVNVFNTRNAPICREVLGMTVRIPRCHPDPENPQIGDTPKYGIPGVGNAYSSFPSEQGWIYVCEKRITGYGTLGDFVSAIKSNLQMDIEITVNEPRLWLSYRPYITPCNEVEGALPPDLVYRIQITETLDYQILEYYFIPVGYWFDINAHLFVNDETNFPKYLGDDPVCNPACQCQTGKSYEVDFERNAGARYSYFSEPYYLFEKSGGETPTLVRGEYQASPEYGNGPDVGLVVMPDQLKEQICPVEPNSIFGSNIALRSKASCMKVTVGDFPFCETTQTFETNICYTDFLEITYG